jgi:hypothetical protein
MINCAIYNNQCIVRVNLVVKVVLYMNAKNVVKSYVKKVYARSQCSVRVKLSKTFFNAIITNLSAMP